MQHITWLLGIIVAVSVAWYLWQESLRKDARENLANSNGTFDIYAEKALDKIEKIQCPTTRDKFLMARLIDLNAHEGRINNVHVLNSVIDKYMANLKLHDAEDYDDLDWFEIDQIENFVERHRDIMVGNPNYNDFIEAALAKRPKKIRLTIEQAKVNAENKSDAFDVYIQDNIVHTSDAQNVHDSAVNVQLKKTLQHLRLTSPKIDDKRISSVIQEIRDYVRLKLSKEKSKRALIALSEMTKSGGYNSTLDIFEKELVALVWNRSHLKENVHRKRLIQDAIVQSLVDMVSEKGDIVCPSGRCARLVESLIFTDVDENGIVGALTSEQIRNDALNSSNDILQQTVDIYAKDGSRPEGSMIANGIRNVAKSYKEPSIATDAESENRFKIIVKDRINTHLLNTYSKRMSSKDFNNLRNHCFQAVDSI